MSDRREHWEHVHRSKKAEEQAWFQPRPETSLALLRLAGCGARTRIIDVGGGTSRLVDELIAERCRNLTVLDVSASALAETRRRLGEKASHVRWIEADVTSMAIQETFDLWHDRAVFHFLTEAHNRAAYVQALRQSLEVGGHAIVATFAEDGPAQCSGLPVVRYSPERLLAEFGQDFHLVEARPEAHRTPTGRLQSFVYGLFRFDPS